MEPEFIFVQDVVFNIADYGTIHVKAAMREMIRYAESGIEPGIGMLHNVNGKTFQKKKIKKFARHFHHICQ